MRLYKNEMNNKDYADFAIYCNENNLIIEDKGEYFEGVEIPPYVLTIEEVRQQRESYRAINCDPLTCRKIRLTALDKWTEQEEQDYINAMNDIEALIDKLYPYTTESEVKDEQI